MVPALLRQMTLSGQAPPPPLPDGPPNLPRGIRGLTFQQTDGAAVISGPAGSLRPLNGHGVTSLVAIGTPGSTLRTVTLDASAKDVVALTFDIPVPNFCLWTSGEWTIRLHVQDENPMVTWNRTELWRVSSTGTVLGLLGIAFNQAVVFTAPGHKRMAIRAEGVPTRVYGDRVIVVCCFSNQGTQPPWYLQVGSTSPQSFTFVADQVIDSPFQGQ